MLKIIGRGHFLSQPDDGEPEVTYTLKLSGDDGCNCEVVDALGRSPQLAKVQWDGNRYTFIWNGPQLLDDTMVWSEVNHRLGNLSLQLEREAAGRH